MDKTTQNRTDEIEECIVPSHPYRRLGKDVGKKIEECNVCSKRNTKCPSYMPVSAFEEQSRIMRDVLKRGTRDDANYNEQPGISKE